MKRIFCLIVGTLAVGSAVGQDTLQYRDRSAKPERVVTISGQLVDESVGGIKFKPVGPERTIPVNDIVDLSLQVPGAAKLIYSSAVANEAKKSGPDSVKALQEAEKDYRSVLAQLRDEKTVRLQRQIEFKLLFIRAALAGEDKVKLLQAAEQFEVFRKKHPKAWQYLASARQQAQMLVDLEQYDPAMKVYDELARNPDLPKLVIQETNFLAIETLMRAKNFATAEVRLNSALATLPADDPMAERMKIYQIGCQAATADLAKVEPQLKAYIDKTADVGLKALAYNTLGDVYSAKGRKDDAKWAHLWVDAVYSADRGEHLKALERLAQVFKDLGDEEHSAKYREKLARLK